jgi:hypothetical protein
MSVPGYPAAPAPKVPMGPHARAGLVSGGLFLGLLIIGVATGGGGGTPVTAPAAVTTTAVGTPTGAPDAEALDKPPAAEPTTAPTTEAVTEPAAPPTKKLTVAQENAVEKAASYLEYSAFSRTGLIKQLKFEGFSTKDATFGVDAQKANWNEQAVKKATEYLDYSSFSRSGLISQLKFEGFTTKQAEYGVKKAGL